MRRLCTLNAIVTMDIKNNLSNYDGSVIFKIPEFERRIRQLTLGCTIIVGRKTWESMKPLNHRHYIVLTRDKNYDIGKINGQYKVSIAHRKLDVFSILAKNETSTAYLIGSESLLNEFDKYIHRFTICKIRHNLCGRGKFKNTLNDKKYLCIESKECKYYNTKELKEYKWQYVKYVKRQPDIPKLSANMSRFRQRPKIYKRIG